MAIRRDAIPAFDDLAKVLGLPLFVKPASQGSSVGVSRVSTEAEFRAALAEGFKYDRKLLAEEFIGGREIECAVLEDGDGSVSVSRPGEIAPSARHGFYSYDAKYVDKDGAALMVPADLPAEREQAIRDAAAVAFRAAGCDGWARGDFFVTPDGRFLINELNTIPGCTDISMYPSPCGRAACPCATSSIAWCGRRWHVMPRRTCPGHEKPPGLAAGRFQALIRGAAYLPAACCE